LRRYNEEIDEKIIKILYKKGGELTFREIEDQLKPYLDTFSYETYSNRLKQLSKVPTEDDKEQSRYAIQPVLNRRDEKGRGGKVYYSLTKTARIRCDLDLPILNSETMSEKAYRILSRSLAFENSSYRKLKDENGYNTLLQKLGINENELQLDGKPGYNGNFYKVSKWIHQDSGIKFSQSEYLEESDNYGKSEYYYQLPGISIYEFIANNKSEESAGLAYGHLDFNEKDEAIEYFKLLEGKGLMEKLRRSRYLTTLNEEDRYIFVDKNKKDSDKLKEFFRKCWLLHGSVTVYLNQKWKCIQPPTDKERVWYEHLWGKERTDQIINSCYQHRMKFNKSKNVKSEKEDIQKLLKSQLTSLQRTFKSIKNAYSDIIDDYSYLANPLLNLVYPQFFRT
jgi:hypothetical protein